MACKEWNDEWIAKLYDELDREEDRRLADHLDGCAECRKTFHELEQSREILRASAPHVPAAPRVLVQRTSRLRQPMWAFASGLAAALLVFAAGLYVGQRVLGETTTGAEADLQARLDSEVSARTALETRLDQLERALADVVLATDSTPRTESDPEILQAVITRDQFDEGLDQIAREMNLRRAQDMEFLLDEMTAIERRAAKWVDETRGAVRLVALQNDPRINER